MVSSLGKRSSPSIACKTWSARNHSQWAKRCAPTTTDIRNAVSECASGMALLEVGSANGRCCCTCRANPIWPRKEMKLARPPKGEIALGVSSKTSLASPKSEVISGAGRFVQGRVGLFKHQSLCPQPFPQSDPFSISEFGVKSRKSGDEVFVNASLLSTIAFFGRGKPQYC